MRMKNERRGARLRAKFTEMSVDSIRYPENLTRLDLKPIRQFINQRFPRVK
ncbi:hypothetical protein OKW29_001471 [Paraburkholderia sp. CI3]